MKDTLSALNALHQWELAVNAALKALKLSIGQARAILLLHQHGPIAIGQFAGVYGLSKSTLTVIADSIERLGLLQRRRSPTDRRVVTISLTEQGVALVPQIQAALANVQMPAA